VFSYCSDLKSLEKHTPAVNRGPRRSDLVNALLERYNRQPYVRRTEGRCTSLARRNHEAASRHPNPCRRRSQSARLRPSHQRTPKPESPVFITFGTLDGNSHPAVVLLVMDIAGQPAFRCSATLIAPKVVLTAGHCAGQPGEFSGMRIFTEADVQNGNNTYPFAGGPNAIEATEWHSHPLFTESAFFLHDVGVVLLSKAFNLPATSTAGFPRRISSTRSRPRAPRRSPRWATACRRSTRRKS